MHYTEDFIVRAIEDAVGSTDNQPSPWEGFTVVTTKSADELRRVLGLIKSHNELARDLKYLVKMALGTQDACNPRPVSLLLHNAMIAIGEEGGNPGMKNSPLIRLILNTLLNTLGYYEHPAYTSGHANYSEDCRRLEEFLRTETAIADKTV